MRPEALRISRIAPAANVPSQPAAVLGQVFLGNCVQVQDRLSSGATVVAEVSRLLTAFQTGEQVHLRWNPSDELRLPPEN